MDDEILNDSLYNIIYYYFSIILLNDKQIELKLSDYGNKQIEKIYTNDVINESKKRKDKTVLSYISISSGFDYNKYKEFVKKYKIYLNETKEKVDKENQKVYSSNIISVFKMNGKNIELVEDKNAYFMIVDGVKDNLELSKTEYLIKPFTTINDNIIKCIYKGKEHYLNIKTKVLYEIPPQTLVSTDFKNGYALMVSPTAYIQELIDTNFNIVAKAKLYTYINDFKNYSSIELSKENDIITYRDNNDFITHRVIKIEGDILTTKGDSNNSTDTKINKSKIVGKVLLIIPKGGIIREILIKPKVIISIVITLILFSLCSSYIPKNKREKPELIELEEPIEFIDLRRRK